MQEKIPKSKSPKIFFRGLTVQKLTLHYSMNNFLMTLITKELLSSY